MGFPIRFHFLVVQDQLQPFAELQALSEQDFRRPHTVQAKAAPRIGVVEVGLNDVLGHGDRTSGSVHRKRQRPALANT
jgi:hypothetical protein